MLQCHPKLALLCAPVLPTALKLKNFLSYRDDVPILHLEGVHVACLSGANGHGKSALLDAITWALWGKARGQSQEQLLHQGSQEMAVELEFEARGQQYRVTRRYVRVRGQGRSSLELAFAAGDGYRAITSDTILQTEAKIKQLIGMDYDTFINSAFLLQGRAHEFSMSTPGQRKEVLARVLGLDLYDRLEDRAKAAARKVHEKLVTVNLNIEKLEEQASQRRELEQGLVQMEHELDASQSSIDALQERMDLLRTNVNRLERLEQEAGELAVRSQRAESRRLEAEQEIQERESRLARWHEVIGRAPQIEEGRQLLVSAQQRLSCLQLVAGQYYELEREIRPLEERVTQARTALESEVTFKEQQLLQEVQPRAEELPALQRQVKQAGEALSVLPGEEEEVARLQERQQQATLEARRLEDDNKRIEGAGRDTRAKLNMLSHAHNGSVGCPLCGTPLGPDAMDRIQRTYEQEIGDYQHQYREQSSRHKLLDQEATRLHEEAARRQRELDTTRQQLLSWQAQVQAHYNQALQAHQRLGELQTELDQARARLEEGRYAEAEQERVAGLRRRLATIAFDPGELDEVSRNVQALEEWRDAHHRLQEARERLQEDEEMLIRARERREDAAQESVRLGERTAELRREMSDLPAYQSRLRELEAEHQEATTLKEQLQDRRGGLRYRLNEAERSAGQLVQERRDQQRLVQQAGVYNELAQAFGKGGVQALLIEAAIPRLAEEANRVLHRMTDGRMTLKFETQRERRVTSGRDGAEPIETLDLLVADELGTRSYQMFSGGESFRVDFALRIGLSKMLAWRAGAPLPTLFIDEGFGTQDAEGRDRILEVIRSIEPDFQRILVITHLEEIKEAFPVRIEVDRTAAGSTFTIT